MSAPRRHPKTRAHLSIITKAVNAAGIMQGAAGIMKGEHWMNDENSTIGTSLLTFLLGVAVGATVAILYAPAAGEDTRRNLAEKAGQIKDKASELKDQVAERAVEWKDRAATMVTRGQE